MISIIQTNAFRFIASVLLSFLFVPVVLIPALAVQKAESYRVGFWEGGAYTDEKTGSLLNCVLTATDNKKNIIFLVRRTNGLYLGFIRSGRKLIPNKKYRGGIRIDALWSAEIDFIAQSNSLVLARIDNLPGAAKALRRGEQMYVTFPSYKYIAPLDRVADGLTLLDKCRRKYGPSIAKGARQLVPDALAARIGSIVVGRARQSQPIAPPQICDRLAGHPDDPGRSGDGISFDQIDPGRAIPACQAAIKNFPDEPRFRYQLARANNKSKDTRATLEGYNLAVKMGYPQGFYALARSYEQGWGVKKDPARALALYKAAFDAGHIAASLKIGNAFQLGRGGPVDYEMAAAWYAVGARKGFADSEVALAVLYDSGKGVAKDPKKVADLAHAAALQKDAFGMVFLGMIYSTGNGVKVDKKRALDWFRLAHAYGNPQAQKLALPLAEELGVGRNLPPVVADIQNRKDTGKSDPLSDPVMDLTVAPPPVVIRPMAIPVPEKEAIRVTFTGLPANGSYWLSLAAPDQRADEFLDRFLPARSVASGTAEFKAVTAGLYELRVIGSRPGEKPTILMRTTVGVGAPANLSRKIFDLMDDLNEVLPRESMPSILRDFAVDTAAAPTPGNIKLFANALAGEAAGFLETATKRQDTDALGIAAVLAEAARSLAPNSVEITLLAASTLTSMPQDQEAVLDAERLLKDAVERLPDSVNLRLALAMVASDTGGVDVALNALEPLLKNPQTMIGDPVVIASLTRMFIDSARFDQGLALIKKLTPKGSKGDRFRFFQAALLGEAGKIDEARALLKRLSASRDDEIAGTAAILLKELGT